MKIQVKLYATLRRHAPDKSSGAQSLELSEGTTIREALKQLDVPEEGVAFVFVNSVHKKLDEPLADGDELGVFPAIAGG